MNSYKEEQWLFRKIPSLNLVLWFLCALQRKISGCVCGMFSSIEKQLDNSLQFPTTKGDILI